MNPSQLIQVLDRLDAAGVTVWLDGGWGVDALVGDPAGVGVSIRPMGSEAAARS
jgi:hypothetical protein